MSSNVHIIAVSKTWFTSYASNASVGLTGYKLILRNDRRARNGGNFTPYISRETCTKVVGSSTRIEQTLCFRERSCL